MGEECHTCPVGEDRESLLCVCKFVGINTIVSGVMVGLWIWNGTGNGVRDRARLGLYAKSLFVKAYPNHLEKAMSLQDRKITYLSYSYILYIYTYYTYTHL